jgi:hypothetical protein
VAGNTIMTPENKERIYATLAFTVVAVTTILATVFKLLGWLITDLLKEPSEAQKAENQRYQDEVRDINDFDAWKKQMDQQTENMSFPSFNSKDDD